MAVGRHWEWRGFGKLPRRLWARIEALPLKFQDAQDLADEYLWVPGSRINVKLRFRDLKFKRSSEKRGELECWLEDPSENHAFPLEASVVEKIGRELGVRVPPAGAGRIERDDLLELLSRADPPVQRIVVEKKRRQFEWSGGGEEPVKVTVELAEIHVPERTVSVGIEHPQADPVEAARDALGLPGALRPLSYLDALGIWARGQRLLNASSP